MVNSESSGHLVYSSNIAILVFAVGFLEIRKYWLTVFGRAQVRRLLFWAHAQLVSLPYFSGFSYTCHDNTMVAADSFASANIQWLNTASIWKFSVFTLVHLFWQAITCDHSHISIHMPLSQNPCGQSSNPFPPRSLTN